MIQIAIADDHPVVRAGLADFLRATPDMDLVRQEDNVLSILSYLRRTPPDVLVLDLRLPGGGGFEVLHAIRELKLPTRVLILSFHPESLYGPRCLAAGAHGYVEKDAPPDSLLLAIRAVASGRTFFKPDTVATEAAEGDSVFSRLSEREFEVISLLVSGRRNCEIALQLDISEKTVSTHKTNALAKLAISNMSELYSLWDKAVDVEPLRG